MSGGDLEMGLKEPVDTNNSPNNTKYEEQNI